MIFDPEMAKLPINDQVKILEKCPLSERVKHHWLKELGLPTEWRTMPQRELFNRVMAAKSLLEELESLTARCPDDLNLMSSELTVEQRREAWKTLCGTPVKIDRALRRPLKMNHPLIELGWPAAKERAMSGFLSPRP